MKCVRWAVILTFAAMVVLSASIWPFMDAIARHLGERDVPATQIAWGRYMGTGARTPVHVIGGGDITGANLRM